MWEYRTEIINAKTSFMGGKFNSQELDKKLNELGKQDWELVSFATSNQGFGDSRSIIAIFKRKTNYEISL